MNEVRLELEQKKREREREYGMRTVQWAES